MKKIILTILFVLSLSMPCYANDYIVKLKTPESTDGLVAYSTTDYDLIAPDLNIYCVSADEAEYLKSMGLIEKIEENAQLYAYGEEEDASEYNDPYYTNQKAYFDLMNIPALKQKGYTGEGVRVCVIDTGVKADHPDLADANIVEGYNYVAKTTDTTDLDGHGTYVCGVIAAQNNNSIGVVGIAPKVTLVPLIALQKGTGTTSNLIEALTDAVDKYNSRIISISLGTTQSKDNENTLLEEVIANATDKGAIVICCAGNEGTDDNCYPASCPSAICIGSVEQDLTLSDFSQTNNTVDAVAVGRKIATTNISGRYSQISGTSVATPIVSSIAALFVNEDPDLTQEEFRNLLKAGTIDLNESGHEAGYGYGFIDAMAMYEVLTSDYPCYISPFGSTSNIKIFSDDYTKATLIISGFNDGELSGLLPYNLSFNYEGMFYASYSKTNDNSKEVKIYVLNSLDGIKPISNILLKNE